ncbi:MAG: hypothetical protein KGN35_10965, partial [Betaproteobacteria bacterium]|nr:hypothetical protein [Betaproteobacteria bacterium]
MGGIRKPSSVTPAPAPAGGSVRAQIKSKLTKNLITAAAAAIENTQIASIDTVSWGGMPDNRVDNYYITEESDLAKLGASLGWLLQLDGDNMRNAFLNAPWVKAVIPIHPA